MVCDADDCGFQMLSYDEIVNSVREESDSVDDEADEDEDNNEYSKGPSNADAFSALDTAMECYEQQSECAVPLKYCCSRESETLHSEKTKVSNGTAMNK
ncbi:hypothetical protein TNCV_4994791 [Trichonephila clavipes]|nr:hypothetical protein TNCV_4994791 [Trichonephila clavipes]